MGFIEALASVAGTLSYKVKKTFGVDVPFPEEYKFKPIRDEFGKVVIPGWTDQNCAPEERTLVGIPAQMNKVKIKYSTEVSSILSNLHHLNKKLEKASDAEKPALQEQIEKINLRFDEIKAEVKVEIDKIRSRYDLKPDDDQSDPNWGYRV